MKKNKKEARMHRDKLWPRGCASAIMTLAEKKEMIEATVNQELEFE